MTHDPNQAAIKATARLITDDNALAVARGLGSIPDDEVIAEPNAAEYIPLICLQKTAPQLAPAFGELLVLLRDLNARYVGERTVDVQARLSLTGEHEWLEERFLAWCQRYFKIRGSFHRLGPQNGNDPWRLYMECFEEFSGLLEERILQPGTINSSVLNLSQRFMLSGFAAQVLGPDLRSHVAVGRDRFVTESSRFKANDLVRGYSYEVEAFTAFLKNMAQNLPEAYVPEDSAEWLMDIRTKVARCTEDLSFLRCVLCVLNVSDAKMYRLTPDLWARLTWDIYHGGSVAAVLTSSSAEPSTERATEHLLAFRRDGWLCHREYPWLRVQPGDLRNERRVELGVSWYILDTLTFSLYEAWDLLDSGPVLSRGLQDDATEEEKTAAIAVALAEPDTAEAPAPVVRERKARIPRPLWLSEIEKITTYHFQCEWSKAKGSERKVFRPGGKQFTFGCHGTDRMVYPAQINDCLKKLGIPWAAFLEAWRRKR